MYETGEPQSLFVRFFSRTFGLGLSGLLLCLTVAPRGFAQQPAIVNPARITAAVDDSALVTLKGNVHPLAKPKYDAGPANASLPADRMELVLRPSPGQEIALRQLLGSLQDPNSSQYRKWLTPEQFGAEYGVSDADIQTITTWLESQGFKVNSVNKAHTTIEFSGSIGQLQGAFHTQIHNFLVNGKMHLANISDPQIPAALAPVVAGLSSMNNFFPRPPHLTPKPASYDKATRKFSSDLTVGSASQGYSLFVTPADAATIYDTPNSFNFNFGASGTSYTGSGVTIGIIGGSDIDLTNITNYRTLFGLPASTPTVIVDGNDPGVDTDAEVEALLDLETSGGLAPGAAQNYYTAANTNLDAGVFLAVQRALNDNVVDIISLSLSECELGLGNSANTLINSQWEQAAAQGITVNVSSSDSGSAGCDDFDTAQTAQFGLQVNGFSSTPFNISVGGTDYDVLATDFTKYVATTDRSNYGSALGYISEATWNDSTNANGLLAANTAYMDPTSGDTNIVAGSGGVSSCINPSFSTSDSYLCNPAYSTGTLTGWAKPAWQTGGSLNIPNDGVRDLPDLSLLAGDGFYGASWLLCADIAATDNTCVLGANGFSFYGVGGTSAASPAFAGMVALIEQSQSGGSKGHVRLGQANYVLYNLANQASLYSSVFHDVTVGNNSVPCVSGSPDCGSNLFETGYNTGTAYDLATGLGSVDVTQLVDDWSKATFTSTTAAITINGGTAPVSITHGQAVAVDVTVTGPSPTPAPTGDVAVISNANQQAATDNSNSLFFATLGGGTTGPLSYANLPGGTYTISANYGGDIDFAQSQSSPGIQVTVAKENSVLDLFGVNGNGTFTPSGSYPYGTQFSLNAQPLGASQVNSPSPGLATGSVVFADTAGLPTGVSGTVAINSLGYAELPIYYWTASAQSVSASYAGDNSFNASTAAAASFTVTKAPTANTVTSSVTTVTGGTFTVTSLIVPNPASGANNPTGTVTLTIAGTSIGTGTVSAAFDPNTGASEATVTITVNASSLAAGANTITATYSGDANYAASAGTVVVTSTSTPAIAISAPAPAPITAGNSETVTVTVTPSGGFTGAVNLTCSITAAGATSPPTCSYNPTSVTISGSAAATSVLTIATMSTTTAETYVGAINAADAATGKITATNGLMLTVNAAGAPGMIALTSTAATVSSPGQSGTSTITITPTNYTGTINLTCALTSAPSGANATYNPTCSLSASSVKITSTAAGTATATFATTAPTTGALAYPETNRRTNRWYTPVGGAALACVLLFGIPARRRGWRSMLGLLIFLVAMAGAGCGGGGNNNHGTPGTATGTYTFTVTGTDSVTSTTTGSTPVTVTVN